MTKYQQEMTPDQIMMSNNTKAFIKYLEMRVGQLSRQMAAKASASRGFIGNNIDNLKNECVNPSSWEIEWSLLNL